MRSASACIPDVGAVFLYVLVVMVPEHATHQIEPVSVLWTPSRDASHAGGRSDSEVMQLLRHQSPYGMNLPGIAQLNAAATDSTPPDCLQLQSTHESMHTLDQMVAFCLSITETDQYAA